MYMCMLYMHACMYVTFIVLGSAKQEIKLVSSGDSVFLPCVINASNNIYPQPDHIEWWKGNIRCDPPLQCKVR